MYIKIPLRAISYIIKQRGHFLHRYLRPLGWIFAPYIILRYKRECLNDFEEMRSYLPNNINTVLDIGGGIGGFVAQMSHTYPQTHFHLVDGTDTTTPVYGFLHDSHAFYNSLALTNELLRQNNVRNYTLHDTKNTLPNVNYDVIVSLSAMGFHFSVDEYIERLNLSTGGVLILDVRIGKEQEKILSEKFSHIDVIWGNDKRKRIACRP